MSRSERVGLLGGTFDPVHNGHLDAAREAERALGLDRVLLMPARVPPHRASAPQVSPYHRFAMVALGALTGERLRASDLELQQTGPSYTASTLRRLRETGHRAAQLFFITGSDAFEEIATWKDYPDILDLCHFAVVARPGHSIDGLVRHLPELAERMHLLEAGSVFRGDTSSARGIDTTFIFLIAATTTDVSSTELRQRLASDQPIDGLVPSEVEAHIRKHELYRDLKHPSGEVDG